MATVGTAGGHQLLLGIADDMQRPWSQLLSVVFTCLWHHSKLSRTPHPPPTFIPRAGQWTQSKPVVVPDFFTIITSCLKKKVIHLKGCWQSCQNLQITLPSLSLFMKSCGFSWFDWTKNREMVYRSNSRSKQFMSICCSQRRNNVSPQFISQSTILVFSFFKTFFFFLAFQHVILLWMEDQNY